MTVSHFLLGCLNLAFDILNACRNFLEKNYKL